jgi:2'-hydroxyisoflavone reductase
MDILILGGTRFLGKALVEAAVAAEHNVSLFNRGISNPDWFPEVEKIHADRNEDLSLLTDRRWQAVIDTCAYFPRQVDRMLRFLNGNIEHYTFISSVSVYGDFSQPGLDEGAELATTDDPEAEQVTGENYGALKALCEKTAETHLPGKCLVIRPGLIVGPYDPTDRFTYWPARVARGGEILAPDSPDWLTQIIDVRDLANWILRLVEKKATGIFNATGPAQPLTFGKLLETCQAVSHSPAQFIYLPTEFLFKQNVQPWSELPLWLPEPEYVGMDQVSIHKALTNGLEFRPLTDTIRDTLAWQANRPADYQWRAGLSAEREAQLLADWRTTAIH